MLLHHMSDKCLDLLTQMQEVTRNTTNMLLSTLTSTSGGNELCLDVTRLTEADWDNTPHEIHTEFIPRFRLRVPDRTLLTILVKDTIGDDDGTSKTALMSVSVLLAHHHTEYHTRYIPLEWNLDLIETGIYDQREYHLAGGVALAAFRCLAIQMGISLAAQNRSLDSTTIDEMRTHGVPETQETQLLRYATDHFIDLIRNTSQAE